MDAELVLGFPLLNPAYANRLSSQPAIRERDTRSLKIPAAKKATGIFKSYKVVAGSGFEPLTFGL